MEGTLFKILGDRVELSGARVFPLGLSGSQGLSDTVKLCARVQIGGQIYIYIIYIYIYIYIYIIYIYNIYILVAKYSLQMCFVWLEPCFKQFLISYQHLTSRRFHMKINFLASLVRVEKYRNIGFTFTRGSTCSLAHHSLHLAAASTYSIWLIFIGS